MNRWRATAASAARSSAPNVKRRPDAARRSSAGATPVPTRSARNVSIVTSSTFGAARGGEACCARLQAAAASVMRRCRMHETRPHQPIVASALQSPCHVGIPGDAAFDRGGDPQRRRRRSPRRVRRAGDGVLEAGVQVRAAQVARVAGRRGGSDAGILPARVREGLLRLASIRRGRGSARISAPVSTATSSNARKADARLKRGGGVTLVPLDFDEAERELRLQASERDRRLRRLLPPRVAARPVRARGGATARRLRRARARRAVHVFEQYDLAGDEAGAPDLRRAGAAPRPLDDRRHQRARRGAAGVPPLRARGAARAVRDRRGVRRRVAGPDRMIPGAGDRSPVRDVPQPGCLRHALRARLRRSAAAAWASSTCARHGARPRGGAEDLRPPAG